MTACYYKSFLNPIGTFVSLWLTVIYLYSLKLSNILSELSIATQFLLILAILSFSIGCLIVHKKVPVQRSTTVNRLKLISYYLFFLSIALIEAKFKTPPMISYNKFAVYLDESGIGLPILHFSVVLLPVVTCFIIISNKFKLHEKIVSSVPPLILLVLWMQRGLLIWYIFMLVVAASLHVTLKKQIITFTCIVVILVMSMHYIGTSRSSGNDYIEDYINTVAGIDVKMPPALTWLYIYPTTSLNNFNQVVMRSIEYDYGYGIIEPVLSVLQIKKLAIFTFDIAKNDEKDFEIVSGFNVPTFFYWCYKNLSYPGMFIFPLILGMLSQYFYNGYRSNNPRYIVLYAIWYPNIIYSFHDFLFWNSPMLMAMVLVIILSFKFKVSATAPVV